MKKRVILITIDCLRRDRLKIFNPNKELTPFINKFSKKAVAFDNFISNGSTTAPAFYAMWTSNLPDLIGTYAPIPYNKMNYVTFLQNEKIKTCGIHSNPHLGKFCNYHLGFDDYIDMYSKPEEFSLKFFKKRIIFYMNWLIRKLGFQQNKYLIKERIQKVVKRRPKQHLNKSKKQKSPYAKAKFITTGVIKWLNENYKSSFFLWIHFMDAHTPYYPSSKYIEKVSNKKISESEITYIKDLRGIIKGNPEIVEKIDGEIKEITEILYDAEICSVDHYLGILFKYLKKKNIYEKTNIILTADHGEALFEHKTLGHRASLYDELLRIPFLIKLDNNNVKPHIIKTQAEILDIAPTILSIFNIEPPSSFNGKNLMPLIKNLNNFEHPEYVITAELHHGYRVRNAFSDPRLAYFKLISCRTLEWKLIFDEKIGKTYLYDLKNDPFEKNDISSSIEKNIVNVKENLTKIIKSFIELPNEEELKIQRVLKKDLFKII